MAKNNEQVMLNTGEQLPDYKNRAEINKSEYLKSFSKENGSNKVAQDIKVENLTNEIKSIYPPSEEVVEKPFSTNRLKVNTREANRPSAIYPEDNFITKIKNFLNRNKKKIMLTGVAAGMSVASMAGTGVRSEAGPGDSTKNDAKNIEAKMSKTAERLEIKMANYFTTDKAEISKENAEEISKLINTYVSSLTMENVDKFINETHTLNVSCDPRPTNSYENGNEGLALARANAAQKVINGVNFTNKNLTPEKLNAVKNIFNNLKFNIPPGGVIDMNAVATTAEIEEAKTNETKKLEIYQRMRFVNLVATSENIEKPVTIPENPGNTFEFDGYKRVVLLVDKSPSMEINKKELIKNLLVNNNYKGETIVLGYTSEIDTAFNSKSLEDAATTIEKMEFVNNDKELSIDAGIKALSKIDKSEDKGVVYIVTDEELQDVSIEKINSLEVVAKEKNFDIKFTIMMRGHIYKLDIDQIREAFDQKFKSENRAEDIKNNEKQILIINKILKDQENELLAGNNNRSYLKTLKKDIEETKGQIANLLNRRVRLTQVNIGNFAQVETKKVEQIGRDYSNTPNTVKYPGTNN